VINKTEKYFVASFRYNKDKPEDFGFKPVADSDYCIDSKGVKWKNEYLWDSGWGNEYGFIRQPEPNQEELWILLTESTIEENQLGAAELLDQKYPFELKEKLQNLFLTNPKLTRDLTKRLEHLEVLRTGTNRNEVIGKNIEQIESDYKDWKKLKTDFEKLKTESIWKRITKSS